MLACGGILIYLYAMASAMAGPVDKAVPTELTPVTPAEVKAPPPVKTVEAPPAKVAAKPPKCIVVRQEVVDYGAPQMGGLSTLWVEGCNCCGNRQIPVPGVSYFIPSPKTTVFTDRTACPQ